MPHARTTRRPRVALEKPLPADNNGHLVVGLGASAGGLEAVRKLLAALPVDTGIGFVLIQHLDPTHESMMVDLLARNTAMAVVQAADGMKIERNSLYVIPPKTYLEVQDGMLRLTQPIVRDGARMPFDFFLRSLAQEYGERAVCVVISGTGADGSLGLGSVSEQGGLVIPQDPDEAAYGGMPRSAIATGAVNLVLPAAEIPQAIIRYAQHPYVTVGDTAVLPDTTADKSLSALIDLLRARTSHDFAHYKTATLLRRVRRGMAASGITEIEAYIKALRKDGKELERLAKDLLIHVTSFFRDPAAYDALARTAIPELLRFHVEDQPIRIWVPGCSTGEEAYSIAMLFFEAIDAAKRSLKLQVFASDVSADAVAYGRTGLYPGSIRASVSAERLERFFTRENQEYRVRRDLRDAMVFTVQDLLTDPPFSRLDFISCRNLLIYLQPDEQEKVLMVFRLALREAGFLFLGTAETIGNLTDRFEPVAGTVRVFRRVGRGQSRERAGPPTMGELARSLWPRATRQVEPRRPTVGDLAQRVLLEIAPAAVLTNRKYQGLYVFGPIDRYLRVAPGELSGSLPTMLREGLIAQFQAAVRQAGRDHEAVTVRGARIKRNGSTVTVTISAHPVRHEGEELLLVSFVDEPERKSVSIIKSPAEASRTTQLAQELETTRKELESTIHDLEASNQELTSLNEEAVSMNEEFQSTNEELETSREELQSLNEELTTANSQLQDSIEQQRNTSNDLQNILNSSLIATLFLDSDTKIRFFTPEAAPLFNLMVTDIGRPLADLATRFVGVNLLADARAVLTNLRPIKREVTSVSGNRYLCGISPYRTQENRIEGVVINLADISELRAAEENLVASHAYTKAVVDTIHEPLVVLDKDRRVVSASRSFYRYFGATPADTLGRLLPDTDAHHLDTPALRAFLDRIESASYGGENYDIEVDLPMLGRRTLLVTAEEIQSEKAADRSILISLTDITEFKHATQQVAAKQAAELANLTKSRFLAAASHDLRQPLQTLTLLQGTLKHLIRDDEALTLVARAERTVDTMSATLDALLDINQLEAGVIWPKLINFPINELLDALKAEFDEHTSRADLGWRVVSCGLTIHSDRQLLEEMVRNLLSNAVRYTDKGKILLGCRRHGDKLRIQVLDTGVGISDDHIPHIFEEYHQAIDNPSRGGLGLGLAIVQRLGELLGHSVDVRSKVGRGSVFTIEVPLAHRTRHLPHKSVRSVGARAIRRQGTVLVIEDDRTVREALDALFKKEGHHVVAASDGEAALTLVASKVIGPDIAICDYDLSGGMNGVQVAGAIRGVLGSEFPFIILTGDTRTTTLQDIAGTRCVSLSKPVKADELSQVVQQLLGAWQQANDQFGAAPTAEASDRATTIFLVDDNRDAREAMRVLLEQAAHHVKTFASAEAFLDSYRPGDRGCVVTDVRMPGVSGLELLARLASVGSGLPSIVVTGQGDIAMAVQAMRAGAVDFIEKPTDPDALLASVSRALRRAASPEDRESHRAAAALRVAGLTKREREVMNLVVSGNSNKQIAARLGISQRTTETHRATIMEKMGASSLAELVRLHMAALRGRRSPR